MSDPEVDRPTANAPTPRWVKVFLGAVVVFILAFAVIHLTCGGLHHHGAAVP